jgi:peptidoglycan/xylan/chitin deacetylase (PgdA/CDA1 family)
MMEALLHLKLDYLLRPWFRGAGVVLMFHRILPESQKSKWTSLRGLEVDVELFKQIIEYFRLKGFEFLSVAHLADRLLNNNLSNKFVVITFDDGYVDNFEIVEPIMRKYKVPWTLYLSTAFPNGVSNMWWYGLAEVLDSRSRADFTALGLGHISLKTMSHSQLELLYLKIRFLVKGRFSSTAFQDILQTFFTANGVNCEQLSKSMALNWDQIRSLTKGMCELGGHTVTHPVLSKISRTEIVQEIELGRQEILQETGQVVTSFAYPFGDRESAGRREVDILKQLGFKLAFTTRNGWLFGEHCSTPYLLPRINVSGSFRTLRHFEARLNGLATLRESGLRRFVSL